MLVEPVDNYLKDNRDTYYAIRASIPTGIIAGGAARQIFLGEQFGSTDVDFYFPNFDDWDNAEYELFRTGRRCYHNNRNIGYVVNDIKCQLIRQYILTPENIFNTYDLTCCMFAITPDHMLHYYDFAASDAKNKKMIFMNLSNSNAIYRRVGKYLKKGYFPSCPQSLKIFNEFMKYIEKEYEVPDDVDIFNYRKATLEEIEENIETIFRNFFGYSSEDY